MLPVSSLIASTNALLECVEDLANDKHDDSSSPLSKSSRKVLHQKELPSSFLPERRRQIEQRERQRRFDQAAVANSTMTILDFSSDIDFLLNEADKSFEQHFTSKTPRDVPAVPSLDRYVALADRDASSASSLHSAHNFKQAQQPLLNELLRLLHLRDQQDFYSSRRRPDSSSSTTTTVATANRYSNTRSQNQDTNSHHHHHTPIILMGVGDDRDRDGGGGGGEGTATTQQHHQQDRGGDDGVDPEYEFWLRQKRLREQQEQQKRREEEHRHEESYFFDGDDDDGSFHSPNALSQTMSPPRGAMLHRRAASSSTLSSQQHQQQQQYKPLNQKPLTFSTEKEAAQYRHGTVNNTGKNSRSRSPSVRSDQQYGTTRATSRSRRSWSGISSNHTNTNTNNINETSSSTAIRHVPRGGTLLSHLHHMRRSALRIVAQLEELLQLVNQRHRHHFHQYHSLSLDVGVDFASLLRDGADDTDDHHQHQTVDSVECCDPDGSLSAAVSLLVLDGSIALTAVQLLVHCRDLIVLSSQQQHNKTTTNINQQPASAAIVAPLLHGMNAGGTKKNNKTSDDDDDFIVSIQHRHENWKKVLVFAQLALSDATSPSDISSSGTKIHPSRRLDPSVPRFSAALQSLAQCEEAASSLSHMDLDDDKRDLLLLKRACAFLRCVGDLIKKLLPLTASLLNQQQQQHMSSRARSNYSISSKGNFSEFFYDDKASVVSTSINAIMSSSGAGARSASSASCVGGRSFAKRCATMNNLFRFLDQEDADVWRVVDHSLCEFLEGLDVLPHLTMRQHQHVDPHAHPHSSAHPHAGASASGINDTHQQQQHETDDVGNDNDRSAVDARLPFETLLAPPLAVRAAYVSPFASCASADHAAHISHNPVNCCSGSHHHHHQHQQQRHLIDHEIAGINNSSTNISISRHQQHHQQHREPSVASSAASSSHHQHHHHHHEQRRDDGTSTSFFVEHRRSLQDADIFPFMTNGTVLCHVANYGIRMHNEREQEETAMIDASLNQYNNNNSSSPSLSAVTTHLHHRGHGVAGGHNKNLIPEIRVYENPRTLPRCRENIERVLHFFKHTLRLDSSAFGQEVLRDPEPFLQGNYNALIILLEVLRLWIATGTSKSEVARVMAGDASGRNTSVRLRHDWMRSLLSSFKAREAVRLRTATTQQQQQQQGMMRSSMMSTAAPGGTSRNVSSNHNDGSNSKHTTNMNQSRGAISRRAAAVPIVDLKLQSLME